MYEIDLARLTRLSMAVIAIASDHLGIVSPHFEPPGCCSQPAQSLSETCGEKPEGLRPLACALGVLKVLPYELKSSRE
jgi:hypothetical protein